MKSLKITTFFPELLFYCLGFAGIGYALTPAHRPGYEQITFSVLMILLLGISLHRNRDKYIESKTSASQAVYLGMGLVLTLIGWWLGNFKNLSAGIPWLLLALGSLLIIFFARNISLRLTRRN